MLTGRHARVAEDRPGYVVGVLTLATSLMMLSGCGKEAPAAGKKEGSESQSGVTLTARQIKSLGISTTPAHAMTYRRRLSGYGVVMALDTIGQADAEVATASAAAAQSAAAAARARYLSTGDEAAVSRELVEAAESKAAADRAALALARRKSDAAFGLHAPWQTPAERAAIMAKLASGQAVLVRVTFPLGALGAITLQSVTIARLGNSTRSWESTTVWEAPADPNLPGRGFFCLLEGSDLAQNEHVTPWVDFGAPTAGVLVPQAAVLVAESDTWAYAEPDNGHFVRVHINTSYPEAGGYFVPANAGITADERLVTAGAGLLLAHETSPSSDSGG